jgi:hypothetical protein
MDNGANIRNILSVFLNLTCLVYYFGLIEPFLIVILAYIGDNIAYRHVKAYSETREHGGINGLTPSEMFLQRLIKSEIYTKKRNREV